MTRIHRHGYAVVVVCGLGMAVAPPTNFKNPDISMTLTRTREGGATETSMTRTPSFMRKIRLEDGREFL